MLCDLDLTSYTPSPNEGVCLRYMANRYDVRNRQMRERVKNICDEPKSPNEGACLRYTVNRNRQKRRRV